MITQNHQKVKRKSPPIDHLPAWQARLYERGILTAALGEGWQPDGDGWCYPIADLEGNIIAWRWKAYSSTAKTKYFWKSGNASYYYPTNTNLQRAIADADGLLYIAAGEVDLLTYASAGLDNVLSWLGGEAAVPKTLAADLTALGVRRVVYLPDRDKVGRESAATVGQYLQGSGIVYEPRTLPDELPTKGDTNDLWQRVRFDPAAFRAAINSAPLLELPIPPPPKPILQKRETAPPPAGQGAIDWQAEYELYAAFVWDTLAATADHRRGKHFRCVNPNHTDEHPSARVSHDKVASGVYVCTCGSHAPKTVAAWLNLTSFKDWWKANRSSLFPRRPKRSVQARERQAQQQASIADRVKAVTLPTFTAELTVNLPYISDLPPHTLAGRDAVIKSAIGTGKTELLARLIADFRRTHHREPSVLYVTYRKQLVEDAARRLGLLSYTDLQGKDRRYVSAAPQLAISYDGVYKVKDRRFDIVLLDEITQLLQHTESDTMSQGEAVRSYAALKTLIASAGQVIASDAHADDTAVRWLAARRPNAPLTIENTYTPDRGSLTVYQNITAVYARARELLEQNANGCVVIATSSITEAKLAYHLLSPLAGNTSSFLIHSENSETAESQDFLGHINQRLKTLKLFIYSPSLQTGVDIQTPVRAVLGIFHSRPLAAPDMAQMMGRCRNAQERGDYVPAVGETRETDPDAIIQRHLRAAQDTAVHAKFSTVNLTASDPDTRGMLKLYSLYAAQRHQAMADPLSYFVAYAKANGYAVGYSDATDTAATHARQFARTELADLKQAGVLAAVPYNHATFEKLKRAGQAGEAVHFGYERFKIEDTVGLTITPRLYADLHTQAQRATVRRLADMLTDVATLQVIDQDDARRRTRLTERKHKTAIRYLLTDILQHVFGCDLLALPDVLKDMSAAELERRASDCADLFGEDLTRFLGWREGEFSHNPIPLIRYVLGRIGLKLERRQVMVNRERFMVYSLDLNQWERMVGYARARLDHLAKLREEKAITTFAEAKEHVSSVNVVMPFPPALVPPTRIWTSAQITALVASFGGAT